MIQFYCSSCGRPIEVDDQFAGQQATCPYCNQPTSVPKQSTYRPGIGAGARPIAFPPTGTAGPVAGRVGEMVHPVPPPLPPEGGLHVGGEPAPRELLGRRLGRWALLCTVLAVGLSAVVAAVALIVLFEMVDLSAGATPALEQQIEMQHRMEKEVMQRFPWVLWVQLATFFLCIVGLSLSITSVVSAPRRNWAGLISLIVCALMILCFCTSALAVGRLVAPAQPACLRLL